MPRITCCHGSSATFDIMLLLFFELQGAKADQTAFQSLTNTLKSDVELYRLIDQLDGLKDNAQWALKTYTDRVEMLQQRHAKLRSTKRPLRAEVVHLPSWLYHPLTLSLLVV